MSGELPTRATARELPDIQGGIIGFNKGLQTLLYFNFPGAATGQGFLSRMHDLISPGDEVLEFNRLYKEAQGRGEPPDDLKSGRPAVALTARAVTV